MVFAGAELISDMLHTIDSNYPEMLHKTYVVNGNFYKLRRDVISVYHHQCSCTTLLVFAVSAPKLFSYAFGFVKTFLSEDTRKKFMFAGGMPVKRVEN